VRLARTGVAAGVSPLAALNGTMSVLAWLTYGLEARLPIVWVVSVLALVPNVWTNLLLRGRTTRRDLGWLAVWTVALVVAWIVGWFAAALAVGVVVTQGPQVRSALRQHDLRGLAPATWWVALLDAASWGAYGWALRDPALLGYAVVLSTCAIVVLARIRLTRRQAESVHPPAETLPDSTLPAETLPASTLPDSIQEPA